MHSDMAATRSPPWSARRIVGFSLLWATVLATGGCGTGAPNVALPAQWVSTASGDNSGVEFRPDGSGTFKDFPLWNGEVCEAGAVTLYSGEFRWHAVDGYFQVDSPNGPIVFRADTGVMGDIDWGKMVVSICGKETPSDEKIIYLGTFSNR